MNPNANEPVFLGESADLTQHHATGITATEAKALDIEQRHTAGTGGHNLTDMQDPTVPSKEALAHPVHDGPLGGGGPGTTWKEALATNGTRATPEGHTKVSIGDKISGTIEEVIGKVTHNSQKIEEGIAKKEGTATHTVA